MAWKGVFKGKDQSSLSSKAFLDEQMKQLEAQCEGEARLEVNPDHVLQALKKLKCGKSPGIDGATNEALKLIDDPVVIEAMAVYFTRIVNYPGDIPDEWFQGLVALIPKKERPEPLDHRPIALLSHIALGLNVHSFRNPSTLTVSMSRRIESACANTSVLRFAFKPSPTAAVVR